VLDGALLRCEAYRIWLSDLVVNPDNAAAVASGETFANAGSGTNTGVDVLFSARSKKLDLSATFSWLSARRHDPMNTVFPEDYPAAMDQTVTAGAAVEWQATPHWRFTARDDFHTGRPMSSVEPDGASTVALSGLNDTRLGPFDEVDLHVEWRQAERRVRWSVYLDVLNAFDLQNDFLPIDTVTDGKLDTTMLKHLPIRPFLGVRADF
jgi:hypothetical protein